MNVKEAIKKVLDEGSVNARKDYFLTSCFTTLSSAGEKPSSWVVNFYNPDSGMVLDFYVSSSVEKPGESPAMKKMQKLDLDSVHFSLQDIMKKVKVTADAVKILIFLHKKHKWTINIIGKQLRVKSFEFDARTGKKIGEKDISLVSGHK